MSELLLRVLVVLFPVYIYQFCYEQYKIRHFKRHYGLTGVLAGVCSGFCILFPVSIGDGVIWDFRFVPLIVVALYCSYRDWVVALVLLLLFRTAYSGVGVYTAYVNAMLLCTVCVVTARRFRFRERKMKTKMLIISALATASQMISFLSLLVLTWVLNGSFQTFFHDYRVEFFVHVTAIQIVLSMLVVYLIENMIEMTNLRNEIHRSEKQVVISQLAASIAHEVRNPLTVSRGFLQLLEDRSDEKGKEYVKTAIGELDRAESIISDYLSLAKPEVNTVGMFDITSTLRSTQEVMTPLATMNNAEIEVQSEYEHFHVNGDEDKFKQGLINIVKNSIEAGSKTIRMELVSVGNHVVVTVSDDGPGIPSQVLTRIGSPFYSTKSKGTGLGLTVTFRLFEAMGGSLRYESELGKGTRAIVSLPYRVS